jgi:aldehyde dehydrogenase (NAD+)/coniferyl-aldehyde dehydrogenase
MLNAGQTCVAPDYVLAPRERMDELVHLLMTTAIQSYPSLADNPDLGSIINPWHFSRLQALIEDARMHGARINVANPEDEPLAHARKIALTLVRDCPEECDLMQQEIFGPVLPLVAYDSVDQAIAYVNARPRPLALYLFSHQAALIDRVLHETVSGGVGVNETVMHVAQDDLPFGGVGASGMGQYHAYEGFLTFSILKPVFRQRRVNGLWLLRPPYGRRVRWLLSLMLGK